MSMLSAQVEKLHKAAQTYRTLGNYKLEQLLLDAANTISELRDIAQQAQRENAKMREELEQWQRITAGIELPEYPITEFKPKDLERENAKLRELAWALADCRNTTCGDCVRWDYPEGGCSLNGVIRELGLDAE